MAEGFPINQNDYNIINIMIGKLVYYIVVIDRETQQAVCIED